MRKFYLFLVSLFLFTTVAKAAAFECSSNIAKKVKDSDLLIIRGDFVNGSLSNIKLNLIDAKDRAEHKLIEVVGPVEAEKLFHPRTEKLRGYLKYVLSEENGDAFQFFLRESIASTQSIAYVKLSFEGTFPRFEELNCEPQK